MVFENSLYCCLCACVYKNAVDKLLEFHVPEVLVWSSSGYCDLFSNQGREASLNLFYCEKSRDEIYKHKNLKLRLKDSTSVISLGLL